MLAHCDTTTLIGKRDKALLLIGFAGAFRRSELGALVVDDVFVTDEGLRINVRQSKTDQEAQGQQIAIPNGKMQAVDVLFDWLDHAGIVEGYVFRGFYRGGKTIRTNKLSGQAVADIVKTYALNAVLTRQSLLATHCAQALSLQRLKMVLTCSRLWMYRAIKVCRLSANYVRHA